MGHLNPHIQGKPKVIEIVPYNPEWVKLYNKESEALFEALGSHCLAIHHFGSTAVPGLSAKPVIDILLEIDSLATLNIQAIEQLGFEYRGEVIMSGRYFSKHGRVHLHVFERGNPLIAQNLQFRDWLRTHKEDRNAYEELKKELAAKHTDGVSYARAKTEFVQRIFSTGV